MYCVFFMAGARLQPDNHRERTSQLGYASSIALGLNPRQLKELISLLLLMCLQNHCLMIPVAGNIHHVNWLC